MFQCTITNVEPDGTLKHLIKEKVLDSYDYSEHYDSNGMYCHKMMVKSENNFLSETHIIHFSFRGNKGDIIKTIYGS